VERSKPTPASSARELDETASLIPDSLEPEPADVLAALRELSAQVDLLQGDLHSLRTQAQPLPAAQSDTPGWDDGSGRASSSLGWVRSLDGVSARRPTIPWLLLEVAFLAAVAVAATVAELETVAIIGVMGGAWVLVALIEWVNARAARRQAEAAYAPLAMFGTAFGSDPSWFAPPVERTMLEPVAESEDTSARLPAPDH
jgi:hypothetical protein